MKVLTEQIEDSLAKFQVELEQPEIDSSLEEAYKHFLPRVTIPGFRRGKAPRNLIEQYVGKEALLEDALEHLIPRILEETLKSRSLQAIARPDIRIIQKEPVTFEAVVSLPPTVKLGDYHAIRIQPETIEIKDEDIDKVISQMRERQGTRVPVERPVQWDDLVTVSIEATSEGKQVLKQADVPYEVVKDSPVPLPGFAEKLVGAEKGKELEFSLSYPEEYEAKELAGKEYAFKVTVSEVKEKKLPELDEAFAKSLGHENLEVMRVAVKSQLEIRAEELKKRRYEDKIVDEVVKISSVDYPPVLLDNEVNRLLNEEATGFKDGAKGLEAYLKSVSKGLEEHRNELKPVATERLLQGLVLDKVRQEEKIEVTPAEIDVEVQALLGQAGEQQKQLESFLATPQARHSIEHRLIDRKTLGRLVEIAQGESEKSESITSESETKEEK